MIPQMQQAQPPKPVNIYDLASRLPMPACRDAQALHRIFSFSHGHAKCKVSPELSTKYGGGSLSLLSQNDLWMHRLDDPFRGYPDDQACPRRTGSWW